jgi:hypothetical protein
MLVEHNGRLFPYNNTYRSLRGSKCCCAESDEKTLLIAQYRRRVENGLGIFEEIPSDEKPFLDLADFDDSILQDKKFRRTVFGIIRKLKRATTTQVRQRLKNKYSDVVLQYFFDWCVEHRLLFVKEITHQNKQKTCYYYVR